MKHAVPKYDDDLLDIDELAELLSDIPSPRIMKPTVETETLGHILLTKREYERKRRAYYPVERTIEIDGAMYDGLWIKWKKTLRTFPQDHWVEAACRCKRDSIIKIERIG